MSDEENFVLKDLRRRGPTGRPALQVHSGVSLLVAVPSEQRHLCASVRVARCPRWFIFTPRTAAQFAPTAGWLGTGPAIASDLKGFSLMLKMNTSYFKIIPF